MTNYYFGWILSAYFAYPLSSRKLGWTRYIRSFTALDLMEIAQSPQFEVCVQSLSCDSDAFPINKLKEDDMNHVELRNQQSAKLETLIDTLQTPDQVAAAVGVNAAFMDFSLGAAMERAYGRLSSAEPTTVVPSSGQKSVRFSHLQTRKMKLEQFDALNELILNLDQPWQLAAASAVMNIFNEPALYHALAEQARKLGAAKISTVITPTSTGYVVTVTQLGSAASAGQGASGGFGVVGSLGGNNRNFGTSGEEI